MKRKTLTLCLSLLACLSLIGVGFAAWVISGGDSTTAEGNIAVDTVTDGRYTLELVESTLNAEDNIYFGMNSAETIANEWLKNDAKNKEVLTVSFDVKVKAATALVDENSQGWAAVWGNAININANLVVPTAVQTAASSGLIALPADTNAETTDVLDVACTFKEASSGSEAIYTVSFTFAWGSVFVNQNPYVFYNTGKTVNGKVEESGSVTWGDHAATNLGALEAINEDPSLKYTVTIAVAAK